MMQSEVQQDLDLIHHGGGGYDPLDHMRKLHGAGVSHGHHVSAEGEHLLSPGQDPHSDAVYNAMHDSSSAIHIYAGQTSTALKERDLVWAPRAMPFGYQMQKGVVHRVHHAGNATTVTVQFLSDQHRDRYPLDRVEPIRDITPTYPAIRIHPGARMPTAREVQGLEEEERRAAQMGLPPPPFPPGFSLEDPSKTHERHVTKVQRWGLPEPTLDALRNRSIPQMQVHGYYQKHFYSNLYDNNFYKTQDHVVSVTGHVHNLSMPDMGVPRPGPGIEPPEMYVVGHRYIPLEGPPYEMMDDGRWTRMRAPQYVEL